MNSQFELLLKSYENVPDFYGLNIEAINSKSRYGDQVIHMACVSGNLQDLEIFLNNGADINARGEGGMTPLHYAIEQGHLETVQFLLANGADKSIKDDDGETATDMAVMLNKEHFINALK
ncbi:MAG TPA: ankyrin repeat domain-containing protein [Cellvibrio sp.]|nr:ankyrin repeat domain-containing protein [Cellvibrio sp.]